MDKRRLTFFQIWNMSFGFMGIQFGFALQGGLMSRIFQTLGASKDQIPFLWIAAPLTGLLVQPIIGYLSDRTWHPLLGRRRPYFLIGAVLSSIALFFVPYSPSLWIACGFLWVLDASINISMEPFRALVADKLPDAQRSYGFVVQTLIIGIGTWFAGNLPWALSQLGISNSAPLGILPPSVKWAFAIGAVVFLLTVLYTVITTSEYPPEDIEAFEREKKKKDFFGDFFGTFTSVPKIMIKLGIVQFFSWLAFFSMWSMANPALTEHVFKTPAPVREHYNLADDVQRVEFDKVNTAFQESSNWVASHMSVYGLTSMFFALAFALYTSRWRINRKYVHLVSLVLGGIGFLSMKYIPDPSYLAGSFALVGVAWGSVLSMPYAMLSGCVDPNKMGMIMGIFNISIVLPQIFAALGGVNFLSGVIGGHAIDSMILAGISLILAGLLNLTIVNKKAI